MAARRKAGWWALGPFVYGLFFLGLGIAMWVGAAAVPAASGGLTITAITFTVIGVVSLFAAWYIRRDITSDEGRGPLPGAIAPEKERALRSTGVAGSATVKAFKYLGGSSEGTTLVELQLDVTTVRGGTVAITKRLRVPVGAGARLAAGATVPVTVSPADPSDLVADWDALVPA